MAPSIVLVPGSFCLPSFYEELVQSLVARGLDIRVVRLVTAIPKGASSPVTLPTVEDDAAVVASAVTQLADEGKDVIVVAHSYGGKPATQSVKGLTVGERKLEGKKGGVVRLAYMTAVIRAEGEPAEETSAATNEGGDSLTPVPDEHGWLSVPDIDGLIRFVFNDVKPHDLSVSWANRIERHSAAALADGLSHAGYKDVPVSWLFCDGDAMITPETQQTAIDKIERESGSKVDVTRLEAGHVPYIMAMDEVVAWFEKLVKVSAA